MGKIIRRFAISNLKANKLFEIPFIISVSFMFMMFNITNTLRHNKNLFYVYSDIGFLLTTGTVATLILVTAFTLYANQFTIKRRNKDFALYGILGLEKKHIIKIILIENIIKFTTIFILSITGGYIFSKFFFILILKLTKIPFKLNVDFFLYA